MSNIFKNEPGIDLIIDLWNKGASINEIADKTGKSITYIKWLVNFKRLFSKLSVR